MSKKCVCGFENQDDAAFCRNCGASLALAEASAPSPAQIPVTPPPSRAVSREGSGVRGRLSSVVGNIGRHRAAPQPGLGSHDVAEPVIEYKKLVSKVEKLSELNKVLEGELRMAREKIDQIEKRATTNTKETDETLRGMRGTMTRLLRETDRKLP